MLSISSINQERERENTFHRFDCLGNPFRGIKKLIDLSLFHVYLKVLANSLLFFIYYFLKKHPTNKFFIDISIS